MIKLIKAALSAVYKQESIREWIAHNALRLRREAIPLIDYLEKSPSSFNFELLEV